MSGNANYFRELPIKRAVSGHMDSINTSSLIGVDVDQQDTINKNKAIFYINKYRNMIVFNVLC